MKILAGGVTRKEEAKMMLYGFFYACLLATSAAADRPADLDGSIGAASLVSPPLSSASYLTSLNSRAAFDKLPPTPPVINGG